MSEPFNFKKRLKSFGYAWKGITHFIRKEHNAWIHCAAVLLVGSAGFYYRISKEEWLVILLCFALVLAAEAFNTAIERLVDLISPTHHPLAGEAKDVAAGAVLICAIIAAIAGLLIFAPYMFNIT